MISNERIDYMAANPYQNQMLKNQDATNSNVASNSNTASTNPYLNARARMAVNTGAGVNKVTNIVPSAAPNTVPKTTNSYQKQYKEQSVMTMTQGEMLLKLYEEVIKQLKAAVIFIDDKPDIVKRNNALQKTQKIINHLRMTLNFDYEISNNLNALYEFFNKCIVEANIKNSSKPLKDIIPLIEDLNGAYSEAEKSLKNGQK